MEEMNKDGMKEGSHKDGHGHWGNCDCGYGHSHGYHGYFFLRLLLGLAILGIVFGLGMKIGEFKAEFGGDYGYRMHYDRDINWPPYMMQPVPLNSGAQPQTTTPAK
jgi:hypothetical protein